MTTRQKLMAFVKAEYPDHIYPNNESAVQALFNAALLPYVLADIDTDGGNVRERVDRVMYHS